MENSKIAWTNHTFNPWIGCTQVSPACDNCYAMVQMDQRFGRVEWGPGKARQLTSDSNWRKPLTWNRVAEQSDTRFRVFCASLADAFDSEVEQDWREALWELVEQTPCLDWLFLTKRIAGVHRMVPWGDSWPENVWLGVSVENEQFANTRLPRLLEIPARVRFISAEPLLGDFTVPEGIHWVIAGGESGPNYRESNPDWFRSLRDQCMGLDISFFFKQWSGRNPHRLGRELDGRVWNQIPHTFEAQV